METNLKPKNSELETLHEFIVFLIIKVLNWKKYYMVIQNLEGFKEHRS